MIHDATSYWQHLTTALWFKPHSHKIGRHWIPVLISKINENDQNQQLVETCYSKKFARNGQEEFSFLPMIPGDDSHNSHLPSSSFEEPDDDATSPSSHSQLATGAVAPRLPRPHRGPQLQTMAPSRKNCGCGMGAKVVLGWPEGLAAPSAEPASHWKHHHASGFSKSYKIHRPHGTNKHTVLLLG